MNKRGFAGFLSCLVLLGAAGCGAETPTGIQRYDPEHSTNFEESFIAAENGTYTLEWDSEHYRVLLRETSNGRVWSTLPNGLMTPRYDSEGYEIQNHPQMENPLIVEYINETTVQTEYRYAYTASLKKGDYQIERMENGLRITYHFAQESLSVPVEYTLLEDGMNVSVNPSDIAEGDTRIRRITLSPFFCSVSNTDPNGTLLIPSGSGALIAPYEWKADVGYTCSYPVYGEDLQLAESQNDSINNHEPVRLPVFGAANGETGICAVIDSAEEAASIECNVGNDKFGFSAVYATFELRGLSPSKSYSDTLIGEPISVSYYPLTGGDANYSGIARRYRQTLGLSRQDPENFPVAALKLIGGAHVDAQVLGVPYRDLFVTTSLEQAQTIVQRFLEESGVTPAVTLVGFGESGLDVGRVAGNYKLSGKFGDKKALTDLQSTCETSGVPLYMDYDIVHFSRSGGGLHTLTNAAVTTIGQRALCYKTQLGSGAKVTLKEYFTSRVLLPSIAEQAAAAAVDSGFQGISYATASANAYSDYADRAYYSKGNYAEDYAVIADHARNKGLRLAADNANAYAAVSAGLITCAPLSSDKNHLFYTDVPFYEMVFSGMVPMTSDAINLAVEPRTQVLRAVESGIGLGYTFIGKYSDKLLTAQESFFHAAVFDGHAAEVIKTVRDYNQYYGQIRGAQIAEHTLLGREVRKTVFDNGFAVYVNYSNEDAAVENGTVPAQGYLLVKGGGNA